MPYHAVYVSSATQLMTDDELSALLASSRQNNEELGVTGAMLYQDGNFMQVLEGDRETVENLYEKIARDQRHRNIIRVTDGHVPERQFGDWSMAFGNLNDPATASGSGVEALMRQPQGEAGRSVARLLLASFRSTINLRGTTA